MSCRDLPDSIYFSCKSCDMYVSCEQGHLDEQSCNTGSDKDLCGHLKETTTPKLPEECK